MFNSIIQDILISYLYFDVLWVSCLYVQGLQGLPYGGGAFVVSWLNGHESFFEGEGVVENLQDARCEGRQLEMPEHA